MNTDMANFVVEANRNVIESYSEQIERQEFMKVLEIDGDATHFTKLWLGRILNEWEETHSRVEASTSSSEAGELTRSEINDIIVSFYLALLLEKSGDRLTQEELAFPETLKLDESRLSALGEKFLQLTLTASALFISANAAGQRIAEQPDFKTNLKNDLILILNDVTAANQLERLEAIRLQCEKHLKELAPSEWNGELSSTLKEQICGLASRDNRIRVIASRQPQLPQSPSFPTNGPRVQAIGCATSPVLCCGKRESAFKFHPGWGRYKRSWHL